MNGKCTMLARLHGPRTSALMLAAFMTLALPNHVLGQAWELDREKGVGGGAGAASPKIAAQTSEPKRAGKKVGVRIVVKTADDPVIRPAEGVPVDPFGDVPEVTDDKSTAAPAESSAAALRWRI